MASEVDLLYPQNVCFSFGKTKEPVLSWNGKRGRCKRRVCGQQKGTSVPEQCNIENAQQIQQGNRAHLNANYAAAFTSETFWVWGVGSPRGDPG